MSAEQKQEKAPCVAMNEKSKELAKLRPPLSPQEHQVRLQNSPEGQACAAEMKKLALPVKESAEQAKPGVSEKNGEITWEGIKKAVKVFTFQLFNEQAKEIAGK